MIRAFNHWIARRRFNKLVQPFDDAIEAARRAHGNVRAFQAAKQEAIHHALRKGLVEKAMSR